jgi:hypothetical protein
MGFMTFLLLLVLSNFSRYHNRYLLVSFCLDFLPAYSFKRRMLKSTRNYMPIYTAISVCFEKGEKQGESALSFFRFR